MRRLPRSTVRFSPVFLQALSYATLCIVAMTGQAAGFDEAPRRERLHRQILEKRQAIFDGLQTDLESVETWCDKHGLPEAIPRVLAIRQSLDSPEPNFEPPRLVTPEVDGTLPLDEQQWRLQIQNHRRERGAELYSLARQALRNGFPSLAFSLISEVVRIDPDHKYARSVLGQLIFSDPQRKEEPGYAGEWVSQFEKLMRSGSKPQTFHPEFGWIPITSVSRYEEGLRPWKGGWISEEKEAEHRRDFRNAWEIPSEHFLVKTNVSLEVGLELSQKLELYYEWLQQHFAAFFETPAALQDRFDNATLRGSVHKRGPMELHFYAKRDEYQKRVEGKVPPNLETTGYYSQETRTTYFFMDRKERTLSTLFHEATHQILDIHTLEARRAAARARAQRTRQKPADWALGERSNFWIIEGLACYFESFEINDGKVSIGRPDHVRFVRAIERMTLPDDQFYLPSKEFLALGKNDFMHHPQVAPLYTQAAGFTHFLMHYEDGLYRDDLIALLAAIYRPDGDYVLQEPSLARLAEVTHDAFDQQYRTHMQNLAEQLNVQPDESGVQTP